MKKIKEISVLTFAVLLGSFVFSTSAMAESLPIGEQVVLQFTVPLGQGANGETVRLLQSILATDPTIFSDAYITGYFGPMTKNAVKKFQKKYGIEQAGRVGPITLKKLNELLAAAPLATSGVGTTTVAASSGVRGNSNSNSNKASTTTCVKIPPGHLIAPGYLKKNGPVTAPDCQILPPGIAKKLAISPATTTPDITAPIISNLTSGNLTLTSAKITWTTNELATSQVFYGTTTSYGSSTVMNTAKVFNHEETLTGLASSTLYHYSVRSVDRAGNAAVSADATFTTATPDTTAPVISAISATSTTVTSTTILWTTNELADSKVYYSTTTPINTATASSTSNASLITAHTVTLTGLTASTTHYYVVQSIDLSSNKATSTEQSFTTLSL